MSLGTIAALQQVLSGENEIDHNLRNADVILLLVSADFIASEYCYEAEMKLALNRQEEGSAKVIPVILRPTNWQDLPFGKLQALPKNGKPITTWPDRDEAFVDAVKGIKNSLQASRAQPAISAPASESPGANVSSPRSSNLRIKKSFSEFDLDRFKHECFDFIANFFQASAEELTRRHPQLQQIFRRIDANTFTAAIYENGKKVCAGSATIANSSWISDAIMYSHRDDVETSYNESVQIKADDQQIYLEPSGMISVRRASEKLSQQGAAEFFWNIFIGPLQ